LYYGVYGAQNWAPLYFYRTLQIIAIDSYSKPNDLATASAVDAQLKIEASESLESVTVHCLLIHDRIVEYVAFTKEVRKLL